LREDFCAIKKRVQNRKGRKKKMARAVKKGRVVPAEGEN